MSERSGTAPSQEQQQWLSVPQVMAMAEQHRQAGRLPAAEDLCRQVLRSQPQNAEVLHLLGIVLHQGGNAMAGIESIKQAIAANGNVALFHCNLGEMCRLSGRLDEAVAAGRRALALQPNYPQALNNLGIANYDREDYEAAAECYRQAVRHDPNFAEAHSNLGNALRAQHKIEEAIAAYHRALQLKPNYSDAVANLASVLHLGGRLDDSVAAYRRAFGLDPLQANAHAGYGLLQLLAGKFEEGWFEYEWRLRGTEAPRRQPPGPTWEGDRLNGRRILIHAEQGYGDAIHFCRYLPMIRDRGGKVIFQVLPGLGALIAQSMPWLEITTLDAEKVEYDCHCPLLSVPLRFQTRLDTIPAAIPYLRAPAEVTARWQPRIRQGTEIKVGIAWAGNPRHINDLRRSIAIEGLAVPLAMPAVRLFSLQVGPHAGDVLRAPPGTVTDLSPYLSDFAETAGAVEGLDLVVTVDTSVAHLAGALGKPVWVLLPGVPDWRWLVNRGDSPWYPTMRLFRQSGFEGWSGVVEQVAAELKAVAGGARERLLPAGGMGR